MSTGAWASSATTGSVAAVQPAAPDFQATEWPATTGAGGDMTEPNILPTKRAGDADRDAVIARLNTAFTGGFITKDEFDIRVQRALEVPDRNSLMRLISDLDQEPKAKSTVVVMSPPKPPVHNPPIPKSPTKRHEAIQPWHRIAACGTVLSFLWMIYVLVAAINGFMPLHSVMHPSRGAGFFLSALVMTLVWALIFASTSSSDE